MSDVQRFNSEVQRAGKDGFDAAVNSFGEANKGFQAIAAEIAAYSKKSFEDGTRAFEQLIGAKSFEQAFEIQSQYAKKAFDAYVAQTAKLGQMYVDLARGAYNPVEQAVAKTARKVATVFDERGVRDAQIEDVARAVGINRAIIYRHFSGKEELFALTMVGYLDELDQLLGPERGPEAPAHAAPRGHQSFVDFGLQYPAFVDCAQTLMRRPGPELLQEVSESALFRLGRGVANCMEHVITALQAGNASGEFKVSDPALLANTLYSTGLGGLQLARLGLLVRSAAPGIPEVAPLSTDQVKKYLVDAALSLATA